MKLPLKLLGGWPAFITGGVGATIGLFLDERAANNLPTTIILVLVSAALASASSWWLLQLLFTRSRSPAESPSPANPPGLAEWLIILIVPRRRADAVLGDLEERFQRDVGIRGLRRAQLRYWAEALRSTGPILWMKAKRLGFLALVAEIWRRSRM
jgi:hypothetical protein